MAYSNLTLVLGKQIGMVLAADKVAQLMAHDAVAERIIRIGVQNILKDSHASIAREDFKGDQGEIQWRNESRTKAESVLADMLAGKVRAEREGGGVMFKGYDAMLAREARKALVAQFKRANPDKAKDKDALAAYVTDAALLKAMAHPAIIKIATDLWAIEKAKGETEIAIELDL